MKRLTIKQFRDAYRVMKARGWGPTASYFCNKDDMKVCPIAALAYSTLKRMPPFRKLDGYPEKQMVKKKFGVTYDYLSGVISGVDHPGNEHDTLYGGDEFDAGRKLGKRLNELFIK